MPGNRTPYPYIPNNGDIKEKGLRKNIKKKKSNHIFICMRYLSSTYSAAYVSLTSLEKAKATKATSYEAVMGNGASWWQLGG